MKLTHSCESDTRYNFHCYKIENTEELLLSANDEYECSVNFCPFCGYRPFKLWRQTKRNNKDNDGDTL